jgi:hypothetical protein
MAHRGNLSAARHTKDSRHVGGKEKAAARRELKDHYDDDIIEKEGPRRLCRPKSTERQHKKRKKKLFSLSFHLG